MRRICLWVAAGAALVVLACRPKGAGEPPSELWLRVQCAGTEKIARDANSATLRKIAALPATAELRALVSQRLVTELQKTLRRASNAAKPDAADLLRPLLDEAQAHEFVFECHGRSNAPTSWSLAVQLGGGPGTKPPPIPIAGSVTNRARQWETNYRALVARLNLGEPKKFNAGSFGGWNVTQTDGRFIDYLEVGHWVIVGLGTDRRPMAAALERANKLGRPAPALSNAWLWAEGDLARFSKSLPAGDALEWPRFDLTVTARNTNLVTTARLQFAQPLATRLPAWNLPVNYAQDPVISFTAARGTRELVGRLPFFQRLALTNAPEQVFFWAQTQIPFQSHAAAPLPGAGAALQEIARRLPFALGTNLQNRAFGEIRWSTNHLDLIWAGLPIVVPYLREVKGPDGSKFLFGGLFPQRDTQQPLPAELLQQLQRPDLVYYDWEITEERLQQWRQLWQLWALATLRPASEKSIAQVKWLEAIAPLLGNTVTDVTRTGARELTLVRKSHAGFTGFELLALARRLDEFLSDPAPSPPGLPVGKSQPAP